MARDGGGQQHKQPRRADDVEANEAAEAA